MTTRAPRVDPLGEGAWVVTLAERFEPSVHEQVLAVTRALETARLPDVDEIVPAYTTVTVFFDPLRADPAGLRRALERVAGSTSRSTVQAPSRIHELPVRYDGPDLDFVAAQTRRSREDVIARHTAREYRVYLLGFAPGFAYLGDLDPALALPRRPAPRTCVPSGSVAIAGLQTAVYPLPTPGGWHLIGTTTVRLFDPAQDPPALLRVGDRVRFVRESA